MAKINLLPWREELRKRKQKDFLGAMVLSVLLGFLILDSFLCGGIGSVPETKKPDTTK